MFCLFSSHFHERSNFERLWLDRLGTCLQFHPNWFWSICCRLSCSAMRWHFQPTASWWHLALRTRLLLYGIFILLVSNQEEKVSALLYTIHYSTMSIKEFKKGQILAQGPQELVIQSLLVLLSFFHLPFSFLLVSDHLRCHFAMILPSGFSSPIAADKNKWVISFNFTWSFSIAWYLTDLKLMA